MHSDSPADLAPEFFATMVESVGVGVAIYGQDGRYIYVNEAYADLFDVAQSALIGTPIWEIAPGFEADMFADYVASFADGDTRTAETVHEFNGKEVPVETITTRWTIDGTAYQFGTIRDITERKAREREIKRQNERLENFASIVSHDLRNPLNVAQGYLDLLKEDVDRDEVHLVDNALDRMETLITELLELARSKEEGGETEEVSLDDVATDAWRAVSTADAVLSTPADSVTLIANGSRLQQLFENLFRNAIEHGGTDVKITVAKIPDGFSVADSGSGIPSETREQIFEAGFTTHQRGTGFGLSIVKQIVEGHDWEIQVTESDEGGAQFDVTGIDRVEEPTSDSV
ncbi:MAG: nitrogen regulation protein NR(II) [Halopenitus sp.]